MPIDGQSTSPGNGYACRFDVPPVLSRPLVVPEPKSTLLKLMWYGCEASAGARGPEEEARSYTDD